MLGVRGRRRSTGCAEIIHRRDRVGPNSPSTGTSRTSGSSLGSKRSSTQPNAFFDRCQTVSGVGRGEQRRRYDERKRVLIPGHGLRLVVIEKSEFVLKSRRIARGRARDLQVVRRHFA